MKIKEAEALLEAVRANTHNSEKARALEYDFYVAVLCAVAKGANQFHAQKLAKIALKTQELDFERRCS